MKTLSDIFPIKLYLSIFQLEGYEIFRFLKWVSKNILVRSLPKKRVLVYTLKTKLLLLLSIFIEIFILFVLINKLSIALSVLVCLVILSQFYLLLIISRLILYPFEKLIIALNIYTTNKKIRSLKGLNVIAITGSYGKTSVKEILFQLIKDKFKTLRTPESYNTILGISKVVDYELDNSYEYFICEMAAYHKGDIKNLCKMVPPDYGILTGITSQHLERFGNLNNVIKTKFELLETIQNKENIIFNLNDGNISNEINNRQISKIQGYLEPENIRFSKNGSTFDISTDHKIYHVQTNLFGLSNIQNIIGAITMSIKLGIKIDYLLERVKDLTPVANRFTTRKLNKATIIDNTFSSNEESFKEMVETAKLISGTKVLITPGLVELGNEEDSINKSVGVLSSVVFEDIVLVGSNNRTKSFASGLKTNPVFIADTRADYFTKIEELSSKFDWIFLENDVTENY